MKLYFFIALLGLPKMILAQIDFKNPPWEIGCLGLETQTELNICSGRSFRIADSILTITYKKIVAHLEDTYNEQVMKFKDDKEMLKQVEIIKKQKIVVMDSQENFYRLRENMAGIVGYQFFGGSMRPLMMNNYALMLTVNQLKVLTEMIDDCGFKSN